MINWQDTKSLISKYFTVGEATRLDSWGVYHIPSEEEKQHIIEHAAKLDLVHDFIKLPMIVHCWIRPLKVCSLTTHNGENYNEFVKSVNPNGAHPKGLGTDFHFKGKESKAECQEMRLLLVPKLKDFGLRLEDIDGTWLHLDSLPVKSKRFFKP